LEERAHARSGKVADPGIGGLGRVHEWQLGGEGGAGSYSWEDELCIVGWTDSEDRKGWREVVRRVHLLEGSYAWLRRDGVLTSRRGWIGGLDLRPACWDLYTLRWSPGY
jgi:hypothetical protein